MNRIRAWIDHRRRLLRARRTIRNIMAQDARQRAEDRKRQAQGMEWE